MPIIGLTQDVKHIAEGMPIIGKLRKGAPKKGNGPGKDLDYFRFSAYEEYVDLGAQDVFTELYGPRPATFANAMLVSNDVDEAFSTWLEWWTANETLQIRTDGKTVVREYKSDLDEKGKPIGYVDANRPVLPVELGNCKEVGRLALLMPDFVKELGVMGVVTVETHSKNDIIKIHRTLTFIKNMYGKIIGIPYLFGRIDREISTPGWTDRSGKHTGRKMATKSLFMLEVMPEFVKTVMLPEIEQNLIAVEARPSLAATNGNGESTRSLAATIDVDEPAIAEVTRKQRKTPLGRTPRTDGTAAIKDDPDVSEAEIAEVDDSKRFSILQIRNATEKSGTPLRVKTDAGAFNIVYSSVDALKCAGWPIEEWRKVGAVIDIPEPYIQVIGAVADDPDNEGDQMLIIRNVLTEPEPAQSHDDPNAADALPYHERLTTEELQHLWDMANAVVVGTDADVAEAIMAAGMPVDTTEQRAGIMRDYLEMSNVVNEKQAHDLLAKLGKA